MSGLPELGPANLDLRAKLTMSVLGVVAFHRRSFPAHPDSVAAVAAPKPDTWSFRRRLTSEL